MKNINKFLTISFCLILAVVFIANAITPQKNFSQNENRTLKTMPKATIESVTTGEYMKELETFTSDQFIFRNYFVMLKAVAEKAVGKFENNGIYFAKDDYLIDKPYKVDENILNTNLGSIKKFADTKQYNVTMSLVPTAFEILKEKLPPYAYNDIQPKIIQYSKDYLKDTSIDFVDPTSMLVENNQQYIYYKTDHHQTSLGSYYTYRALADALKIKPFDLAQYEIKNLTDEFYGSTWSKAPMETIKPDLIDAYIPKEQVDFSVEYVADNRKTDTLYETKHLETKDKYSVFIDGNQPIVKITSSNKNGKSIAIFKDSYAHSLAPFLANHYETVHLIDVRYLNLDPRTYLDENKIKDILILYNLNSFISDSTISKIGAFIK